MIVLHVGTDLDAGALTPIGLIGTRFPGMHQLRIAVGDRHITLGPACNVDASGACLAALREFGEVEVHEQLPDVGGTGPSAGGSSSSPDLEAEDG